MFITSVTCNQISPLDRIFIGTSKQLLTRRNSFNLSKTCLGDSRSVLVLIGSDVIIHRIAVITLADNKAFIRHNYNSYNMSIIRIYTYVNNEYLFIYKYVNNHK